MRKGFTDYTDKEFIHNSVADLSGKLLSYLTQPRII